MASRALANGARFAAAVLTAAACSDSTPGAELPPPDTSRIIVFFPTGDGSRGTVQGRAFPGTFPAGDPPPFVSIRSLPTAVGRIVIPVDPDGGFDFSVVASGREILEVAAAADGDGAVQGPSGFVRVPPAPFPTVDHICCQRGTGQAGVCVPEPNRRDFGLDPDDPADRISPDCPDPEDALIPCESDRACVLFERQYYRIEPDDVTVTPPDAEGRVEVRGRTIPNGLVLVENRRRTGVGVPDPITRDSLISNTDGTFVLTDLRAQGDDELVIQAVDLNDFRTPTLSIRVPDPPMERAELIEVWPASDLITGRAGLLGLRFALTGEDGRGLCPDSDAEPAYCLSGGLTFEHIQITAASIDQTDVTLCPAVRSTDGAPATGPCAREEAVPVQRPLRGVEGDVRLGPQSVVVLVDFSLAAARVQGVDTYHRFVRDALEQLRAIDQVALMAIGPVPRLETDFVSAADPAELRTAWEDLAAQVANAGGNQGPTRLFASVAEAAERVRARAQPGRILLTAVSPESQVPDLSNPNNAFDRALNAVRPRPGQSGIPVDIVGLDLDAPGPTPRDPTLRELLESLAQFSGNARRPGRFHRLPGGLPPSVLDLQLLLRDARGQYAGGFLMLYELLAQPVSLDDPIGKVGTVRIEARVTLDDGSTSELTYRGPLEFARVTED